MTLAPPLATAANIPMPAHFFEAAERAILDAIRAGEEPVAITVTSALYRHLDDGEAWRDHSERAKLGYEPPRDLYGCRTSVEMGAHQAWEICCASGARFREGGRV